MLDICRAETHMIDMDLYRIADEHPISKMICERQLQFTGHCLRMPKDEPANIYVIYQGKSRQSNHYGYPGLTYLDQISKYLIADKTVRFSAEEIANYAKDKQLWNLSIATQSCLLDEDDEFLNWRTQSSWSITKLLKSYAYFKMY